MSSNQPSPQTRETLKVWRRQMELPRYLRTVEGSSALVQILREVASELGFARLYVVSGPTVTLSLGADIAASLEAAVGDPFPVRDNDSAQVELLACSPGLRKADAVVAVGGGRTIDVAKLACEQADVPLLVVPTQLTADGIASPVSVVRAHSGDIESRRARLPIGVVVDLEVVMRAPVESTRAGLGDLLANACAVRDWRRAENAGVEVVDDFAALLAEAGGDLVCAGDVTSLAGGTPRDDFMHRLLYGLVLSGLAMEIAGSSRPCSGSEHLVSHAIDRLHPQTARHGEQVAFGTLVCSHLQGEDWRAVRGLMISAGMDSAARGFGLSQKQVLAAMQAAPSTRPGRYTILNEVDLSERSLGPIVAEVLRG